MSIPECDSVTICLSAFLHHQTCVPWDKGSVFVIFCRNNTQNGPVLELRTSDTDQPALSDGSPGTSARAEGAGDLTLTPAIGLTQLSVSKYLPCPSALPLLNPRTRARRIQGRRKLQSLPERKEAQDLRGNDRPP